VDASEKIELSFLSVFLGSGKKAWEQVTINDYMSEWIDQAEESQVPSRNKLYSYPKHAVNQIDSLINYNQTCHNTLSFTLASENDGRLDIEQ